MNTFRNFRAERATDRSLIQDLILGAVSGFVATLAMSAAQKPIQGISEALPTRSHPKRGSDEPVPATVRAAEDISEAVLDRKLPKRARTLAGETLHFAFGISM